MRLSYAAFSMGWQKHEAKRDCPAHQQEIELQSQFKWYQILMKDIFPAGVVAAYIQGIISVLITALFLLAAWWNTCTPDAMANIACALRSSEWVDGHLLSFRYLLTASALSILVIENRFINITSEKVRRLTSYINPIMPRKEIDTTYHQLLIAAICFGIAALQAPPSLLRMILGDFGPSWISSAVWSGLASAATAAFGASAIAVSRAL